MLVAGGGGGTYWPGQFASVNTWVNTDGGVQQATFSVDMDQVPGLIAKYEEAREMLDEILQDAQELRKVAPPGTDETSVQLADNLGRMAGGEEGCLSWAVTDGRQRIQDQIDQLKAALHDYQNADEAATPRIA